MARSPAIFVDIEWANAPDAGDAPIARRFNSLHHWQRATGPQRLAAAKTCMRGFALFLLIVVVAGCGQRSATPSPHTTEQDVPVAVLQQIPQRVKLVKVGMIEEEALTALGLAGYALRGLGGGPPEHYNWDYYLRTNCVLTLGLDMSRTPPRVKIVRGGFAPAVAMCDG
jgi:hypothetical protein